MKLYFWLKIFQNTLLKVLFYGNITEKEIAVLPWNSISSNAWPYGQLPLKEEDDKTALTGGCGLPDCRDVLQGRQHGRWQWEAGERWVCERNARPSCHLQDSQHQEDWWTFEDFVNYEKIGHGVLTVKLSRDGHLISVPISSNQNLTFPSLIENTLALYPVSFLHFLKKKNNFQKLFYSSICISWWIFVFTAK